jgi:hypothetical protein
MKGKLSILHMKKEYKKLLNSNLLNEMYKESKKEDFIGSATKNLIQKCQFLLYYYPLFNNLLHEQVISDFFLVSNLKIRNTVYNFDSSCSINFKKYYLNFIKISVKYYKLKVKHDYLYDNLNLEVVINHSDAFEKEIIYDDSNQCSTTIATFKYKFEEDEPKYILSNEPETNFTDKTFYELFYEVLNTETNNKINYTYSYLNPLKKKVSKKSTRRSILLLLLTMPDAVLDNFIDEVSYVFSTDINKTIELFTSCRNLQSEKYERFNKYSQLNNKHYKNYLINHYKLTSQLYDEEKLNTSIAWDKKAMINNADKLRKTLNMHVSQRTLAKALDIKKGTVASSISSAKSILNQSLKLS